MILFFPPPARQWRGRYFLMPFIFRSPPNPPSLPAYEGKKIQWGRIKGEENEKKSPYFHVIFSLELPGSGHIPRKTELAPPDSASHNNPGGEILSASERGRPSSKLGAGQWGGRLSPLPSLSRSPLLFSFRCPALPRRLVYERRKRSSLSRQY